LQRTPNKSCFPFSIIKGAEIFQDFKGASREAGQPEECPQPSNGGERNAGDK